MIIGDFYCATVRYQNLKNFIEEFEKFLLLAFLASLATSLQLCRPFDVLPSRRIFQSFNAI